MLELIGELDCLKTLSLLGDISNFEPLFSIMLLLRGGEVCEVAFRTLQIVSKSALFPSGDNFSFVSRNRRDKRKKQHQNLNSYCSAVNPLCCWCSCKIKPPAVSSEAVAYCSFADLCVVRQ